MVLFSQAATPPPAPTIPGDFFTPASVVSFGGIVLMTTVVCNTIQVLTGYNPRWLAFIVSEAFCLVGYAISNEQTFVGFLLAVVNGCLVFLTAVGATSAIGGTGQSSGGQGTAAQPTGRGGRRGFWTPWF